MVNRLRKTTVSSNASQQMGMVLRRLHEEVCADDWFNVFGIRQCQPPACVLSMLENAV